MLGSNAQFANGPFLDVTDSFEKGDSLSGLIAKGKIPKGMARIGMNQTRIKVERKLSKA